MKYIKYIIPTVIVVSILFSIFFLNQAHAVSVFITSQGGTGSTTPSGLLYGDNGATTALKTVQIGNGLTFLAGVLSASGGSGLSPFASTTSTVAGQNVIYPLNNTDILTIGSNSTTTADFFVDPNAALAYFLPKVGIGTTSPFGSLSVGRDPAGASLPATSLFAVGSTTAAGVHNTIVNVLSSGFVGINTVNPSVAMHVTGSTVANGAFGQSTTFTSGNIGSPAAITTSNSVVSSMIPEGSTAIGWRAQAGGGTTASTQTAGSAYASFIVPRGVLTEASSGNHPLLMSALFRPLNVTAGVATVSTTSTVYIEDAATTTVTTGGNYSLYVNKGPSYFNDIITAASTTGTSTIRNLTTTNAAVTGLSAGCVTVGAGGFLGSTGVPCVSGTLTGIGPAGQIQPGPTITIASSTTAFNGLTLGQTWVGSGNTLTVTPNISGTLGIGGGGTGTSTAAKYGDLLSYNGTNYQGVATSTLNLDASVITSGTLPIARGGTATSTGGVTGGISYFDGTKITNSYGLVYSGGSLGVGTASPTNTFTTVGTVGIFRNSSQDQGVTIVSDASANTITGTSTVANPKALVIQTDVNSGNLMLRTVGASQILFNTSNTQRMAIDANGLVGIGTSTPDKKLNIQVANAANVNDGISISRGTFPAQSGGSILGLRLLSTAGGVYRGGITMTNGGLAEIEALTISATGLIGVGTTSPWGNLSVVNSAGGPGFVVSNSANTATQLIVDSSGNVGIGTTSPYTRLSVNGDTVSGTLTATSSGSVSAPSIRVGDSTSQSGLYLGALGTLSLTNGTSAISWDGTSFFPNTDNIGTLGKSGSRWLDYWGSGTATTSVQYITSLATPAGAFLAVDPLGRVIATTSPTGSNYFTNSGIYTYLSTGTNLGVGTTTPGSLFSVGGDTTGTNFYNNATTSKKGVGGYDIAGGCFSINGVCIAGGTAAAAGSTGQVQFNDGASALAADSSFFWDNTNKRLGIGTSTPATTTSIGGDVTIGASAAGGTNGTLTYGGVRFANTVTGTGSLVGGTAPTFTTSIASPIVQGGTAATTAFTLRATSSASPSTASLSIGLGSTAYSTLKVAGWGIGTTTPAYTFQIASSTASQLVLSDASATSNSWAFRSAGSNLYVATTSPTTFATSTTAVLSIIGATGRVGIGTTSPATTLTVQGSFCVTQGAGTATIACDTTLGSASVKVVNQNNYDLAERYPSTETLVPGTIVTLDKQRPGHIKKARQGDTLLGIVSTEPGSILGGSDPYAQGEGFYDVALVGHVPLKVRGSVSIGERLTASYEEGYARVANTGEETIGYALSSGTDVVEVFLDRQQGSILATATRSVEENWQWIAIGLLALAFLYQQRKINILTKRHG